VKARRHARVIALQALYEIDSVGHSPGAVLQQRMEEDSPSQSVLDFIRQLVFGVLKHKALVDPLIQEYAPEWPLEQMAYIDRNILRIAIFEFAVDGNTPVKVAINEAVELAKMFGSDSSPRFVNGVLGALVPLKDGIARRARAQRESEMEKS
jgi:N utilization substance protein B